jgi:hypothetical protein
MARILAVLLTALAIPAAAQATLTPAQYAEDLAVARSKFLPNARAYSASAREEADRLLASAIARADRLDDGDFAYTLAQASSLADDLHTSTFLLPLTERFARLPFRFYGFRDGYFVTRAAPGFEDLLGARVERLGALPIAEAIERGMPYCGGPAIVRQLVASSLLHQGPFLRRIGAGAGTGAVPIAFRLRDGTTAVRDIPLAPVDDAIVHAGGFDAGLGATVVAHDRTSRWVYGGPPAETRPPWLRDTGGNLVVRLPDLDAIYVRIDAIQDSPERSIHKAAEDAILMAAGKRPAHVIVDLRPNGGGDFTYALSLAIAMPRLPREGGNTYVIVGRHTASAAIVATAFLRHYGGSRTILVGEPMADRTAFWAEGQRVTLPNSKVTMLPADGYHDWEHGCTDWSRCYVVTAVLGVAAGPLDIDLPVVPTYAEFAAGRDVAIEAISRHARR